MGANYLELRDKSPICRGDTRNVFDLPQFPDALLKTVRPDRVDAKGYFIGKGAIKKLRLEGCYHGFAREMREYLVQFRKHYATPNFSLPIAHIHGIVQTDQGAGLLTEKIVGTDGALAPTIGRLHATGRLTDAHRQALATMLRRCGDLHIVLSDIHANNIVYTEARNGVPECVCIDGFGERVFIPVHRWSQHINRRKIERITRDAAHSLGGAANSERWGRRRQDPGQVLQDESARQNGVP